ncbi:hypothetical protein VTJ83DRAFT_190 [Remersonia thermophila]|uniref:SPRY domain-containing protein n=1 Tax=Remersonia thermophila TaxID=72144 RepID=A0ABR4DKC9_9PEZI
MCFGSNKDADGDAPRPAQGYTAHPPEKPQRASLPPQYQQQQHQQHQQHQQPPQQPPSYAPPPLGPPPSQPSPAGPGSAPPAYAPPPGAPPAPSHAAPPPGPPPAQHNWEALVPDTSLFPPPPSFFSGFDRSPGHNATEAEAEAGEAWCAAYPLAPPVALDAAAAATLAAHDPRLMRPMVNFAGSLAWTAPGLWSVRTERISADSTIIAYPPLYNPALHSPLSPAAGGGFKTIYYEVQLAPRGNPDEGDLCLALGFTALPYPSFRMPGWHRGSVAVHGDDGHRFVNDRWGGKAFTQPFRAGERLGVGMTFRSSSSSSSAAAFGSGPGPGPAGPRIDVDVFFTRQGREVGRWDLHEETDAEEDLPVTGLEGYHDLSCAIGTCGEATFEVVLDPARWMHRPAGY